MRLMTTKRKQLMERVASLSEALLDEVAETVVEIVQLHEGAMVHATPEELAGIDRGL